MRLTVNQQTLARYAFANRTGFFGDSLTGDVIYGGNDLDALETELGETKARCQSRGAGRKALTGGAGPYPVAQIGELMNAIDEVQTHAADKSV